MRKILLLPIVQMKEWVSICKEIALNHPANKLVIWDLNQCPCDSKAPAFNHSSGLVASAEQAQLLDLWRISSLKLCGKLRKRIKTGWWACWCQKWELPPPVSCLLGGASPLNGESRAQEARLEKRVIIFFLHFLQQGLWRPVRCFHTHPLGCLLFSYLGFSSGSEVKHSPTIQETRVQSLGWEDALEKRMATHSSILAWRIPRTEDPDRSMGSQRVGCD